ncbi:MAG: HEAT repeat domain-containing protein [Planctomycetia bacterium]|nr:HEAT repeat domain-containing protein [Planctomycetia bacterium]
MSRFGKTAVVAAGLLAMLVLGTEPAAADDVILRLVTGGQMRGELIPVDATGADRKEREKEYVLKTPFGAKVTIAKDQVQEIVKIAARQTEYERIRPTFPDTVEGQLALADWCHENQMRTERNDHLRRVIEIDPNHLQARTLLGYQKRGGEWTTRDELMEQRGYVKTPGGWALPEEVVLREERRLTDLVERQWIRNLNQWRGWLMDEKVERRRQGRENIEGIKDPLALRGIERYLDPKEEKFAEVRMMFLGPLVAINNGTARRLLVELSLLDPDEDVRIESLKRIGKIAAPDITRMYVSYLKSPSNDVVNRAGVALAFLDDKTAVAPLIDALVTVHVEVKQSGGADTYRATFSTDGKGGFPGLSAGGSATKKVLNVSNGGVRDALVQLTGADFGFNRDQWRSWYNAQKRSGGIDTRRD